MGESKHTRGPKITHAQIDAFSATLRANVRLLDAAPDLLEALAQLVDFTERQVASWPDQPSSLRAARAAVAKAIGEPR